jgi:malate dehydrogenase (oxaloacetate-decarboxylating)(NADP+)
MSDKLREAALEYHRAAPAGKLAIVATKPLGNQHDLALAYSPGVAAACQAIVDNPAEVNRLTARGNMVAVITNGTAVLGLGNIGPLAAKPVMEGKAVLFKKFAGIDAIDIEINETDPAKFCDIVAALEPSFGAINLEDIKAPECFEIEAELRRRMKIPVFHDDQHGTAIIVAAAITNWLRLTERKIEDIRVVTSGAGAAALACLDLLVDMGLPVPNVTVTDIHGVVFEGRVEAMDPRKSRYAQKTNARSLSEVMAGADLFMGLSAPGVLKSEWLVDMAEKPLILALANPTPEIMPDLARAARPDAFIATGRSDFPNQVNNVLCFPFIFRGALDVGATEINDEMKIACVHAVADLALAESSDVVQAAYGDLPMAFGPDYLIPNPFDPRLVVRIASAVAKAAMKSGVATQPITDVNQYTASLNQYVFRSGLVMSPIFTRAKADPKRVVFAEGEDPRVLRAVQEALDEGLVKPILIGRENVVSVRLKRLALRLKIGQDIDLVNPEDDRRYQDYWQNYHRIMERRGVSPARAKEIVRTDNTVIGSLMVRRGEADAMICGINGGYQTHLRHVVDLVGLRPDISSPAAMTALVLPKGCYFLCDTHVNTDPTAEQIAEITIMAAAMVREFGIVPKIALLSSSNFGSRESASIDKMQKALILIRKQAPELEIDGEMHADAALNPMIRKQIFPNSTLSGEANLLVMPSIDAANIAYNMVKILADAQPIGPLLLGASRPVHILTSSATARTILNVTALASIDAQHFLVSA